MPLVIRGNILQSRGRVDWLPDGNVTQPSLTFVNDPDTGLYRAGVNDLAFTTGGVDRLRVNGAGTTISGNANITGFTTLSNDVTVSGNANITGFTTLSNDVSVSGNANITGFTTLSNDVTVTGNANIAGNTTVSGNLDVTGFITGQGLAADLSISNVQITDNTWTVVDDTALPPEGGRFLLTGGGFAPGSLCQVGGVSAVSTSYVSPTQLRVEVGTRAVGTYDVTIIRGDTKTATLPYGLTYSNAVTWITSSTLGNVYEGKSFTIQLEATSDSTVVYSNVTSLPAETTLDPVTGNLTGNITSITQSTLFAFDVDATDQELQDARRSFLLQLLVLLINGATYTDSSWNALTQTALDANSGSVYFTVGGDAMSTVTGVLVGGTAAASFTALDNSTLRVTGPQKPRGTYDVTLQNVSGSKTLSNGVFYSDVPQWVTALASLGTTVDNYPFSFEAANTVTSDSNITLSTVSVPAGANVSLDTNIVSVTGQIANVVSDTLYSFDVSLTDEELQRTTKTFSLQHAATYGSPHLGNVILDVLQESANSSTIIPTVEYPPNLSSATGSGTGPYVLNGYEVSSSSNLNSTDQDPRGAFNKINAVSTDCWHSASGTTHWIQLKLPTQQYITSYSITARNDTGGNLWPPKTWYLQGSNNGSSWTTVDSRSNVTSFTQNATLTFNILSPGVYSYYRLYLTFSPGTYVAIGELRFFTGGDYTVTPGGTYPGNAAYYGGVLLPDGRVFCVPFDATTASVYNPVTNSMTTYGSFPGGAAYISGALLHDGRVFCAPYSTTTIRLFNPTNNTVEVSSATIPNGFYGSVLLLDGRVFMVPFYSTTARIYDPVGDTVTTPGGTYPGINAFIGGVLMKDGRVFCVPHDSTTARIYDPVADTVTTPNGSYPGSGSFYGGVLLPDGRVFCVPHNSTTARIYDPVANTTTTPNGTYPGASSYTGGVLLPDGRVFMVPFSSTTARIYDPVGDTTVTTPNGSYPGSNAFIGGVLMKDGRVFCVPRSSTTSRIFILGSPNTKPFTQSDAIVLSPFLNKI